MSLTSWRAAHVRVFLRGKGDSWESIAVTQNITPPTSSKCGWTITEACNISIPGSGSFCSAGRWVRISSVTRGRQTAAAAGAISSE